MTSEDGLEEITKQLQELTIYHRKSGEAINRLQRELASLRSDRIKSKTKTPIVAEIAVTTEECRSLIGNRVRIVNPGRGEANTGTIESVGKLYITVALPNGVKKLWIAKNIRLLHHEL